MIMISQYNYELLGVTMLTTVVLLLLTCINHNCGTKRYNIWKMGLYLLLLNQILDIFRHQHTLNARTEMMLKQSFDAVFCLDEQGRIKLWNNYAETLFHL